MKIRLRELRESYGALERVCAQRPKSAKLAYRLGRVLRSLRPEMGALNEAHIGLIKQFGGVENGDGQLHVPIDRLAEFNPAFDELLTATVEAWGEPLTLEEIDGQLELSGIDFMLLAWLIVDDEAAAKPKAAAVEA